MNRKWKILIISISIVIIALLISLLAVVPFAFGDRFVSFTFQLEYALGPGHTMDVVYVNGSILPVAWIGLEVYMTNGYFRPVQVHYNGFEYVMLVYNCTVNDPADVVKNRDHLIWGGFIAYHLSASLAFSDRWTKGDPYDYYVTHRGLSSYTHTINVGTSYDKVFTSPPTESCWYGRALNGDRISPGIYYIYCIAYGKQTSQPFNLTITSVLWTR